ncbi:MAG: LCP family protein [Lachnospiraceae bacterium]|nr:LCP family protein [Lachnospiraceae bacterium]
MGTKRPSGRRYPEEEREMRRARTASERRRLTQEEKRRAKKKKRRRRISILVAEVLVLSVLCVFAYATVKMDKLDFNFLDEDKLEVYKDTGPYTNIALFGLDAREGESIESGVRSDSMMIASINNETNEVKVVSIFRDTLLKQQDGTFDKANAAYSYGGPEEAIALLNRNLDLDIKNYMSVDFKALSDVIDALGGLELELTEEEVVHMNNYCVETSEVTGKDYERIEPEVAGTYHLNGVQATSYARIRATAGGDYKRAERQRLVIQKIVEKAQKANLKTLDKIVDVVFPQVSTSFSSKDLIGIAANALSYKLGETQGFPYSIADTDVVEGYEGSYVVPSDFAGDVKKLHKFLFNEKDYQVSDTVKEISHEIDVMSGAAFEDGYTDEYGTDASGGYDDGTDTGYSGDSYSGYETGGDGTDVYGSENYEEPYYEEPYYE